VEFLNVISSITVIAMVTVFSLPFLIIMGAPFVACGALWLFFSRRVWLVPRVVVASVFFAVGIAPSFGAHASTMPTYLLAWFGHMPAHEVVVSFARAFPVVAVALYWVMSRRAKSTH
jgi:hypothetical protein